MDTPLVRFLSPAHRQSRNTQGNEARPTLTKPATELPHRSITSTCRHRLRTGMRWAWPVRSGVARLPSIHGLVRITEMKNRGTYRMSQQNFLARASHQRCQSFWRRYFPDIVVAMRFVRCPLLDRFLLVRTYRSRSRQAAVIQRRSSSAFGTAVRSQLEGGIRGWVTTLQEIDEKMLPVRDCQRRRRRNAALSCQSI